MKRDGHWPFSPLLLGMFPILSIYSHNAAHTPLQELGVPLGIALAGSTLLLLGSLLISRKAVKGGLIASLVVLAFYAVGQGTERLKQTLTNLSIFWVRRDFRFSEGPVELFIILLVLALIVGIVRTSRDLRRLASGFNAFALILVALTTGPIAFQEIFSPPDSKQHEEPLIRLNAPDKLPDIYYIILDGYGRSDVLREMYDFDNEPFLERLQARGFHIARQANSNYTQTALSLASTLNVRYLDDLDGKRGEDRGPLITLIRQNSVARSLRQIGYKYVTFSTGYGATEITNSDLYLTTGTRLSPFHMLLVQFTPLRWGLGPPEQRSPYEISRHRTLFLLDRLPEIALDPDPTFTFAHILGPHPPFLFGANGEDLAPHDLPFSMVDGVEFHGLYGGKDAYIKGYRNQVAYLTKRIEQVIDEILENSPEPPIILLQGDHGPGSCYNHHDINTTDLQERLGILNAYYLPGVVELPDDLSPVNSFRFLFDQYFGTNLGQLPNRFYYAQWYSPYLFTDVSDRFQTEGDQAPSHSETLKLKAN